MGAARGFGGERGAGRGGAKRDDSSALIKHKEISGRNRGNLEVSHSVLLARSVPLPYLEPPPASEIAR